MELSKIRLTAAGIGLAGFIAVFGVGAAGAAPVMQVHDGTSVSTGTNPCGQTGTTMATYHLVFKVSPPDTTGIFHYLFNENGTVTFVPTAGLTFTGTFHEMNTANGPALTPGGTISFVETATGKLSDGTHASLQVHEHMTYTPDGTLTANFDNTGCVSG